MKYFIVSGSHRPNAESGRVARYLKKRVESLLPNASATVLELGKHPLPLWDQGMWGNTEKWQKAWQPIAKQLQNADALIVISPEWSGMVPAALKNFFLLCSTKEIGHKPGLIVSVSSGIGGVYPISELRSSSYKNTKICYIPEHIIVRKVGEVLHDTPNEDSEFDGYLRKRIDFALQLLDSYAVSLTQVRNSQLNFADYPYGM